MNTLPVERAIERGIEGEIPAPDFFIDDGTDFPGPGVGRKLAPLVTELLRQAEPHRPVPRRGNRDPRTDMVADPFPTAFRLDGGEDVKASFEPVGDALGDLNGLMLCMMRRLKTINRRFTSLGGEVRVQLNHSGARRDSLPAINLNFIVILSAGWSKPEQSEQDWQNCKSQRRHKTFTAKSSHDTGQRR